jgi:flagellar hook-associated protein 3 FlgL
MRVTSNTYTNQVINSSQTSQQQLSALQQQISSGESVQFASDNPLVYAQASQTQTSLAELNTYSTAATEAATLTAQNNSAMTSLHQIVAQASELATSVTGNMSTASMQNIGTEMSALVTQLTSVVNQQSSNGTYLFGGTSNQPPITSTGAYNTATNGDETTIDVQPGNAVQTGIAAGRPGTPPVDGFLYDSSTGVDVLGSLTQAVTDLNSGNATAVQGTDLTAINNSLSHISLYVGSTAANMSAVSTASTTLTQQITSQGTQLNDLTQTNLPNAEVQLQQIQNQYEASLQAGSRIMSLSILNYISSVPTT